MKLRKFHDTLLNEKKKHLKCLYEPTRVFTSPYLLLPPYEKTVIKSEYNNQNYYSLIKEKERFMDTSSHFWKFKLYWMRLMTWTKNWVVALIGLSWVGPFGLRCLCGINDFSYD